MTDEEIIEIMKRECANQWGLDLVANVLPFARAIIVAERERCAKLAEGFEAKLCGEAQGSFDVLADKIRRGN